MTKKSNSDHVITGIGTTRQSVKPDKLKDQVTHKNIEDHFMCDGQVITDYDLGDISDQDLSVCTNKQSNDQVNHYISSSRISACDVNKNVTTYTPML